MSPVTKILFLTASPSDKAALQLDEEMRLISQRIRRGEYRNLFEMCSAPAIRATDLPFELMDNAPEIVHFSGHGSKTGALYFIHDGDRAARPIPPQTLARVFKQFRDRVKCVVLNACYSAAQAEATTAIAFAASFYEALASGKSVAEALELKLTQDEDRIVAVSGSACKRPIPMASATAMSINKAAQRKQSDATVGSSES